jgi:hypothetical protein
MAEINPVRRPSPSPKIKPIGPHEQDKARRDGKNPKKKPRQAPATRHIDEYA